MLGKDTLWGPGEVTGAAFGDPRRLTRIVKIRFPGRRFRLGALSYFPLFGPALSRIDACGKKIYRSLCTCFWGLKHREVSRVGNYASFPVGGDGTDQP